MALNMFGAVIAIRCRGLPPIQVPCGIRSASLVFLIRQKQRVGRRLCWGAEAEWARWLLLGYGKESANLRNRLNQ